MHKMKKTDENMTSMIRQVPLFRGLTDELVKNLENNIRTYEVEKGELICHEETVADGIFCFLKGIAKQFKSAASGQQYIVHLAHKGDIVGLKTVFFEDNYDSSCEMISEGQVIYIPKEEVRQILSKHPGTAYNVMSYLAHQLKVADAYRMELAVGSVRERLAHLILLLARYYGSSHGPVAEMTIELTREEMAEMIGTVPETLVRILRDFKDENLLEANGRNIKILDFQSLQDLSVVDPSVDEDY